MLEVFVLSAGLWRDGEKVVFVCERRTNVRGTAEGVAKALFPRDDWLEGPVNSGFPFRRERDSLAITRKPVESTPQEHRVNDRRGWRWHLRRGPRI